MINSHLSSERLFTILILYDCRDNVTAFCPYYCPGHFERQTFISCILVNLCINIWGKCLFMLNVYNTRLRAFDCLSTALSMVTASVQIIQQDKSHLFCVCVITQLSLDGRLTNKLLITFTAIKISREVMS